MADYTYVGLTAYIAGKKADFHTELKVLATLAFPFQSFTNGDIFEETDYEPMKDQPARIQNVLWAEEFEFISEHEALMAPDDFCMPNGTPADRTRATVEDVTVNGHELVKIYIPVVAKNETLAVALAKTTLPAAFRELFAEKVVSMKTREALEYEDFDAARETVIEHAPLSR